jgi:CubicO group peptidase (beta-lactamase class C family)
VLETPLEAPPGAHTAYSDVGADVLGFVIEAIAGERLDRFVSRTIYRALGLRNTLFLPGRDRRAQIAPTENYPPRGYPLRGEVHDEAAYELGGVAGTRGCSRPHPISPSSPSMMLNGGTYKGVRIVSDTTVARSPAEPPALARLVGHVHRRGELRLLPRASRIRAHGLHRHIAVDRSRPPGIRDRAHELGPCGAQRACGTDSVLADVRKRYRRYRRRSRSSMAPRRAADA